MGFNSGFKGLKGWLRHSPWPLFGTYLF